MVPRSNYFAVAGLLLGAAVAFADPPAKPPTPPPEPDQKKLLPYMESWEKAMADVKTLILECKRDDKKLAFKPDKFAGKAFFMKDKDDIFIFLQMVKMDRSDPTKPDASGIYERFICNPTACYEYVPQEKKIRFRQISAGKGGKGADDNLLSFLFNTNAKKAMERYQLKLIKEDKDYIYVEVQPTLAADKVDFKVARVVLDRDTFLPRQLWFHQINGDEVLWDLPSIEKNKKLDRKMFDKPELPIEKGKKESDWKYEEMPKEPEPRVVRPKGEK
jgi:TIGR03009 family protein